MVYSSTSRRLYIQLCGQGVNTDTMEVFRCCEAELPSTAGEQLAKRLPAQHRS
jgi:hypothetical protein